MNPPRPLLIACALLLPLTAGAAEKEKPAKADKPKITALERAQGWKLLFDGESLSDWRGYGRNKVPPNWTVADGWLTTSGGPALVSEEEYRDFELLFDWKAGEGGVCAVWLRAGEDGAEPEGSGLLLELAGGAGIGGNGGLTELWRKVTPQPGLWHRAKVTVYGNQVEHWIDGERVLTYTIDSPDWRAAVAKSRFAGVRDYGVHREGRIVLAGRAAAFRNIKIKPL
ncbi:MAG: 3-keto-disaccharide hydrolase [Verrucomicrobiota bacterium]